MNLEKSNRLFILLIAAGLLLVGTTVFLQGQMLGKMQKSLSKIADQVGSANVNQERLMQQSEMGSESVPNISRADCIATGGEYENEVCTCGNGYVLEGSQCVDRNKFIEFGNVSARIPEGWEARLISRDTTRAKWKIVDSASGQERGDISCPIGGAGFEGWNFTESLRIYQRGNIGLYAKKLIGEPLERTGLNWMVMIWAGSTKADTWDVDPTCMMMFAVSNPPTQKELLPIDMIYRSIK